MQSEINPIEIRDYQEEIIQKVVSKAVKRPLVVLPTGTGKTYIFAEIIKRLGEPALILAHRDELITQAEEKLRNVYSTADIGVVKADLNEIYHDITIASVQTLARRKRLEALRPDFGIIVTDEAHHAAAESYKRIYHRYGLLKKSPDEEPMTIIGSDAIHLGVTATPDRNDELGLGSIYDEIVYQGVFRDFVEAGWLCDLQFEGVISSLDLKGIKTTQLGGYGNDFQVGSLSSAVNKQEIHDDIFSSYQKHAENRHHTLAFCVDREHAATLCSQFNNKGIPSAYIDGETPIKERHQILRAFRQREYKIIFNIMVFTEGFDFPEIDCILLARPSRSPSLLTQIIGRGTRPAPNKKNCLILDVAHSHRVIKNKYGEVIHAGSLLDLASLFYPPVERLEKDKTPSEYTGTMQELIEEITISLEKSGPSEYFLGKSASEESIAAYLRQGYQSQFTWHEEEATPNQLKWIQRRLPKLNKKLTKGEASSLLEKLFSNKNSKPKQLPDENTCPTCKKWKKPEYAECYPCAKDRFTTQLNEVPT